MSEDLLFERFDVATLLAVERANGGELATLEQVVSTFLGLFGEPPDAERFSDSSGLLAEAGFVEYQAEELGLTPAGRRLLRHAGGHNSSGRPERLLGLLGELDEGDLAPEGSRPAPTTEAVSAALADLAHDLKSDSRPVQGDLIAPQAASIWGYGGFGPYGSPRF